MHITTLPVYSKLADPADLPDTLAVKLPSGWRLSMHQLATYQALCDEQVDVVINTAMTGDGKSLAGALPLLVHPADTNTLALFPTNELIQDQQRSWQHILPEWGMGADRATTLYGARLDDLAAASEHLSRPEELTKLLRNHKLVLSNPDILHAILHFHYQQFGRDPAHVAGQMAALFSQLTFDEFHIFDAAQITAVLTGLLFLYEQSRYPLKTLFLSATPDERLLAPLHKIGFGDRLRMIVPQREGWYHHGADPGNGWRRILHGTTLHFAPQTAEEWIVQGVDDVLLPWFRRCGRGAKAALIVNSVASALRLTQLLEPVFAHEGLRVLPNTGMTDRPTRHDSRHADLLIGTSTVDVGIDFQINLLIFESTGAGTFLQRLGRLGRHSEYTDRDGNVQPFNDFAAYALVPPYIAERLFHGQDGQAPPLADGMEQDRGNLGEVITTVFPQPAGFQHYARFWGRFQAAKVYATLLQNELRTTFAAVRERLKPRYYALTGANVGRALQDWEALKNSGDELLVQEAHSFRGQSPFACGVIVPEQQEPLVYDLFWLLANARLDLISVSEFRATVRAMGHSDRPYRRGYQCAFFRWRSLQEQRQPVTVLLPERVAAWGAERLHSAQVLPGLEIDAPGHEFINRLNDTLLAHPVVGLLIPGMDVRQARRRFYLPPYFPLQPYQDANGIHGVLALSRAALLLDSRLRLIRLRTDSDTPFIL